MLFEKPCVCLREGFGNRALVRSENAIMCGIIGSVQIGSERPYREEVRCGVRAMAHRGPDGKGFSEFLLSNPGENSGKESIATVLIWHRLLAIIDLSDARPQPTSTPDRRLRL